MLVLKAFVFPFCLLISLNYVHGKGGRGGFSGGSRGRGSSGGSGSSSKHSSNSNGKPAASNSAPSYGWNVKSNSPSGPPPAYPGLANRPVSHPNSPPAYSPGYANPPAYNPGYAGRPSYSNSFNKPYPGYNSNPSYGSTFGSKGLGGNTYIHNNYYGSSSSGGSGFLTNALFFGGGFHHGYMLGGYGAIRDSRMWNSDQDRHWRATTRAPYFENKVPGSESYLPASAIVGAATAFGLVSLLPLNVPANKPLMYCNATDIAQSPINLNGNIYSCVNNSITISCPRTIENQTVDECLRDNRTLKCDDETSEIVHCINGTLLSNIGVVCNETTPLNVNETTLVLNCYPGLLPEKLASFIPTTTTEAPITTTTERQLSIGAKMHIFFMNLVGKGDILERKVQTTTQQPEQADPSLELKEQENAWIPEALTIPPETATDLAPITYEPNNSYEYENGISYEEVTQQS